MLPSLKLVAVIYLALVLFVVIVPGFTARLFGFRIFTLLRVIKDEVIITFSTGSSATVLPQRMKKLEDFGVPKTITTFRVPTGYSFNLDCASSISASARYSSRNSTAFISAGRNRLFSR